MTTQSSPFQYPLDSELLDTLVSESIDYALAHGVATRNAEGHIDAAPFSLLPSPTPTVPRAAFEEARSLTTALHAMKARVAHDTAFLREALHSAAEADEFTRRLLGVLDAAEADSARQPLAFSICRCDYMLHQPTADEPARLQQVEMNQIAASFSNLGAMMAPQYAHVLRRHAPRVLREESAQTPLDELVPPSNASRRDVVAAMARAHQAYGAPAAIVLMVVQPGERNALDQRVFEHSLLADHGVVLRRLSLAQIATHTSTDADGTMRLKSTGEEIALVYYRAGYTPRDYPSQVEWDGRVALEKSRAIKCPTIAWQLCGLKKVQQVLAQPAVLARFVPDAAEAARMQRLFAGLWALGDDADDEAIVARAIADGCRLFVLKPQREGGGNNLYEADATAKLQSMSARERRAFILMSRIVHPTHPMYVVRAGRATLVRAVSELGFYGALLAHNGEPQFNVDAGYLLRSKSAADNDGGVAAGVAVLDAPLLY